MATVTVHIPPILDAAPEIVAAGAADGLNLAMEEIVGRIKMDGRVPVDRGPLRAGLTRTPARRTGSAVTAEITSSGVANKYADVMESGRHAGRRPPPMTAIKAWVRRKMPDKVREVALELQSAYIAAHPKSYTNTRGAKVSRAIGKFTAQAEFLLAAAISRSIGLRGIEGRKFVAAEFAGPNGGFGSDTIRTRVTQMIENRLRAAGGGA